MEKIWYIAGGLSLMAIAYLGYKEIKKSEASGPAVASGMPPVSSSPLGSTPNALQITAAVSAPTASIVAQSPSGGTYYESPSSQQYAAAPITGNSATVILANWPSGLNNAPAGTYWNAANGWRGVDTYEWQGYHMICLTKLESAAEFYALDRYISHNYAFGTTPIVPGQQQSVSISW